MSDEQLDWNDFWRDHSNDPLAFIDDPQTWSHIGWKVGLEEWHDRFRQYAPGNTLLECGCGTATLSRYMTQRNFKCTMLDSSKKAIEIAKAGFAARSLSGTFCVGDIKHIEFEDNSFDIVYSGGVLEFLEDIEKPIAEMVRVLKPGGFFAVSMVPRKFSIQTIGDLQRTAAHFIQNIAVGKFKGSFKGMHLVPSNYHVNNFPLSRYVKSCQEAGLVNVKGLNSSPFPALALPDSLSKSYARFLYSNINTWRKFNELSSSGWRRWVGITYTLYGTKD